MATLPGTDGTLTSLYRDRIGDPTTDDEATGYWIFALGTILGILGIGLFLTTTDPGDVRWIAIVLAAAGLVLLLAGPIIRLPLRRTATLLLYLGVVICAAAIAWFAVTYPANWDPTSGQTTIIGLYALGLLVIAAGGVAVPVLAGRSEPGEADELRDELSDLRATLAHTSADEADLASTVEDLRTALEDAVADEGDLAVVIGDLRGGLQDTEADEADLAGQLTSLRESQARFELYEDRQSEWRWRLRHRNGNVIADGGESYTRRHNAQKGMASVRRNALGAELVLVESVEALPQEESFEPFEEAESQAAFELFEDDRGKHRWRLRHDNGDVIADSGQGYSRRATLEEMIERVREYVGPANYLRLDPTAFEVYRDVEGAWRWRLVHRNGNVLADSGQGYTRRRDARRAIDRIRDGIDDLGFEVYEDDAGDHRWRLTSANNRIVGDSGEGYSSEGEAEDAVERVEEYAPDADVLDVGWAAFEIYEDSAGEHRWRLRHRNGNIIADSGQGYADRTRARDGVESVKRHASNAESEHAET